MEFKENNEGPQLIGEYISALSNAAAMAGQVYGYLVWGIRDSDHAVVGTSFKPGQAKIGNEEAAINQDYVAESIAERMPRYRESTMLMLLSRPQGKAFWDFARKLVDAVNADLNTPEDANSIELRTIPRTIRTVAPDWVFSDMPPVPTISKYARRTTKVNSIMLAGSPGSRKKR